jgi:hypothetical protein
MTSEKCNYLQGAISYINKGTVHKQPEHVEKRLKDASSYIDEGAGVDCLDNNNKTSLMNLINIFDILTPQHQNLFEEVAKKIVEKSSNLNIIVKKPGMLYGSTSKTALDMLNKQIDKYSEGDVPEELSSLRKLIVDKGGKTADELNKHVNRKNLTAAQRQAQRIANARGERGVRGGGGTRRKRLSRRVTRRR